jgi:hypothetical protein
MTMPKAEYPLGVSLREHMDRYLRAYADYISMFPRFFQIVLNEPYVQLRELLEFVDREAAFYDVSLKDVTPGIWNTKIFEGKSADGAPAVMIWLGRGDHKIANPAFPVDAARDIARAIAEAADAAEGKIL